MEKKGLSKYLYYPLRAMTMALFVLLIRQITNNRFLAVMRDPTTASQIHSAVFYLFAIVCSVLITNSVVSLFSYYDKRAMWEYLDKRREDIYFPREIKEILRDKWFYVEALPHAVLTGAFVFLDLYGEFTYVLSFVGLVKRGFIGYGVVALICALIVFAVSLLARYEARRYWHHLKRKKAIYTLSKKLPLIFKAILIIGIYPIAAPYMPYMLFMLFTLAGLVVTLANALTTLGLILAIVATVALIKLCRSAKYQLTKKKITREITETAEKEGYTFNLHEDEALDTEGCDIVLTRGNERYSIRFVKPRGRSLPLYFTERDAYFLYKIGTKNHYRSIESHFDYAFDAEGEKILLLTEIPRHLFVKEGESSRRMNAGDRIWGYIIYEPKSLIGNLDRDCLGRANNDRR